MSEDKKGAFSTNLVLPTGRLFLSTAMASVSTFFAAQTRPRRVPSVIGYALAGALGLAVAIISLYQLQGAGSWSYFISGMSGMLAILLVVLNSIEEGS